MFVVGYALMLQVVIVIFVILQYYLSNKINEHEKYMDVLSCDEKIMD